MYRVSFWEKKKEEWGRKSSTTIIAFKNLHNIQGDGQEKETGAQLNQTVKMLVGCSGWVSCSPPRDHQQAEGELQGSVLRLVTSLPMTWRTRWWALCLGTKGHLQLLGRTNRGTAQRWGQGIVSLCTAHIRPRSSRWKELFPSDDSEAAEWVTPGGCAISVPGFFNFQLVLALRCLVQSQCCFGRR